MRLLIISLLSPLYSTSSMNEITRRLFQLAWSGNTLCANQNFYQKYLKLEDLVTISASEDGRSALRTSQMTQDTRQGKKSLQLAASLLITCWVLCVLAGAQCGGLQSTGWKHQQECSAGGGGGDNPTVASLFWSFFVPFVNRDSHGGHSSSDFLSRDFSGQWQHLAGTCRALPAIMI